MNNYTTNFKGYKMYILNKLKKEKYFLQKDFCYVKIYKE